MPEHRAAVGRQPILRAAGDGDARPPGAVRQRDGRRAPRKAAQVEAPPARSRRASPWLPAGRNEGRSARDTRSPTRAQDAVSPLQWIGANSEPGRWPSLTMTFRMQPPCAVATRAKPPSVRPTAPASSGCTSTNGSGRCVAKPRADARARHRVPLIADAAGVEAQRKVRRTSVRAAQAAPARRSAPCGRA